MTGKAASGGGKPGERVCSPLGARWSRSSWRRSDRRLSESWSSSTARGSTTASSEGADGIVDSRHLGRPGVPPGGRALPERGRLPRPWRWWGARRDEAHQGCACRHKSCGRRGAWVSSFGCVRIAGGDRIVGVDGCVGHVLQHFEGGVTMGDGVRRGEGLALGSNLRRLPSRLRRSRTLSVALWSHTLHRPNTDRQDPRNGDGEHVSRP